MKLSQITRMTRSSSPKYSTVRNAYVGSVAAGGFAFLYNLIIDDNFLHSGIHLQSESQRSWAGQSLESWIPITL